MGDLKEHRDAAYERLHRLCGSRADNPRWDDIATVLRELKELRSQGGQADVRQDGDIAWELANCIGRYMGELVYRRRLSFKAAEFVAKRGFGRPASQAPSEASSGVADAIITQIEERFPNWRSYRDLIDCIDCTLHLLRASPLPSASQASCSPPENVTAPEMTAAINEIADLCIIAGDNRVSPELLGLRLRQHSLPIFERAADLKAASLPREESRD